MKKKSLKILSMVLILLLALVATSLVMYIVNPDNIVAKLPEWLQQRNR